MNKSQTQKSKPPTGRGLLLSLCLASTVHGAIYTNPIASGADPEVVDGNDGNYYMFFTDGYNTARYVSQNLVSWSSKRTILQGTSSDEGWAPALHYEGSTWYMYTVGQTATSTNIAGNFTKVGEEQGFDPMNFYHNGAQLQFSGGSNELNQVGSMTSPTSINASSIKYLYYWPEHFGSMWEGLWALEHGGTYYLILSPERARDANYSLAYATAPSPWGPWTMQTEGLEDSFLRRSDYESIWGPGHHCIFKDSNGTLWVYYQQKESTLWDWNRRIAVDPLWFDSSGRIHMRPTRGVSRPGPNSTTSTIWPVVSATATIEAEAHHGSSYTDVAAGGSGEVIDFKMPGAYLAFRNINFGSGKNGFSARLDCARGGTHPASLEIRLGGVDKPVVGQLAISNTGGYVTLNGSLNQTVSGVHDVILTAQGTSIRNSPFLLDHFTFNNNGGGTTNLPPVAENDEAVTASDQAVTISVLKNDSDANGGNLAVTGTGHLKNGRAHRGGTLSHTATGVTYTPPAGFWGRDTFYYSISDGNGGHSHAIVTVRVRPAKSAYANNSRIVFEAEDFVENVPGSDLAPWSTASSKTGFGGSGYVVTPDNGTGNPVEARLSYAIDLTADEAGDYYLWMRVASPGSNSDTSKVSITTKPVGSNFDEKKFHTFRDTVYDHQWRWVKLENPLMLNGSYDAGMTLKMQLWRQEDGQKVDRFVLTKDKNYDPSSVNGGIGPAVTTEPTGSQTGNGSDLNVRIEAELYDIDSNGEGPEISSGIRRVSSSAASAGAKVGYTSAGAWVRYDSFNFGAGAGEVTVLGSSPTSGGTIEFRLGSPSGTRVATVNIPVTGSWSTFAEVKSSLSAVPTGTHDLYLVTQGSGADIDAFEFTSETAPPQSGLFTEDFESGSHNFTSMNQIQIGSNGAAEGTLPAGSTLTSSNTLAVPVNVPAGTTELTVQTDVRLPAAEVGSVIVEMILSTKRSDGTAGKLFGGKVNVDPAFVGEWLTYQATVAVPSDVVSIEVVRVKFGQTTASAGANTVQIDNVKVE